MSNDMAGYEKPEGLSWRGADAYSAIVDLLSKEDSLFSGGQRVFYTPEQWRARGERYGLKAVLIVVHDGGAHAPFFNYNYECYSCIEKMTAALAPAKVYVEQCTCWYSAVYEV